MTNDQIFEVVVSTLSPDGQPHHAPLGVRYRGNEVVLMPFKPSTTLMNLLGTGCAVLNVVVDTRVIAGCVTGRRNWPVLPARVVRGVRLECALRHLELRLLHTQDDPQRPSLRMVRVHEESHGEFMGFNRAQAAVVEGSVLVSRLHLLPREKVEGEMRYLQIAIDKTAGPEEHEAWDWLRMAVADHRAWEVA
ncbi:DUF447 domain-containing protein [Azohydromonas aeria]|uniref:DUF447 domain-containing protein n=1 Tax=Azohydromonas aeria TaxID=2590212 RepID=UPI0012F8404A|nr:DUF447 domain-containing protein [Azohydromonas aeria]